MGQAGLLQHRGVGVRRVGDIFGQPTGMEMRAMAVEFPVVQIQTELLRAGVLTVAEVRAMRGLEAIPATTVVAE
jgi:hypothetical protein